MGDNGSELTWALERIERYLNFVTAYRGAEDARNLIETLHYQLAVKHNYVDENLIETFQHDLRKFAGLPGKIIEELTGAFFEGETDGLDYKDERVKRGAIAGTYSILRYFDNL